MNINSISNNADARNSQAVNSSRQDSILNSIQRQIMDVQSKLKKLNENKDMSAEEKMNRRKELQQQLQDLNRQLTQRKMELQKEQMERRAEEATANAVKNKEQETEPGTMDSASMHGLVNASSSMESVKAAQSVKTRQEGEARIMESEIKLDQARGSSTEGKQGRLSNLRSRIESSSDYVMRELTKVNKSVKEVREANGKGNDKKADEIQKDTLEPEDNENTSDDTKTVSEDSSAEPYRSVNVLL